MFTLDSAIDTFQNGKKEFVKTFVRNDKIAEALNGFVDAQTTYTKEAVKAGTNSFTTIASETVKLAQDLGKVDYTKFNDAIASAFNFAGTKTKK